MKRIRRQILQRCRVATLALLSFLCAACCGYQCTSCPVQSTAAMRIAVPLIRGDDSGDLRNALARAVASVPGIVYSSSPDAPYHLQVKIISDANEKIGYVWDEEPLTGAWIKRLYPNEGRRKVKISVALREMKTKKALIEPFELNGWADYDFVNPTALKMIEFTDEAGDQQSVLQYSLGQLDSEEGARSEAYSPIARTLADEVALALTHYSRRSQYSE